MSEISKQEREAMIEVFEGHLSREIGRASCRERV